jgi:hypothetical protein
MARNESITPITEVATAPETAWDEQPLHRPFSWLHKSLQHQGAAEFVALTRDVSNGVATILQILHRCYDSDQDDPPLLSPSDSEHLLFLATANMKMLAGAADARIDVLNGKALDGDAE